MNVDRFIDYVEGLKRANGDAKIGLFMDNLSAHTADRAKEAMRA